MTRIVPDLDARLVFVMGSRRSGIHLLQRLLAVHPHVVRLGHTGITHATTHVGACEHLAT